MAEVRVSCAGHVLATFGLTVILGGILSPLTAQIASPIVQELGTFPSPTLSTDHGFGGNAPNVGITTVPEDFSKLRIAPGFLLGIQAFGAPDISGDFRVEDSGDVSLPLSGSVHVAGLTTAEAQQAIQERLLTAQILNHPQVTISIRQYARFIISVLGEVSRPGRVELLAPHSLLDVISQVGGESLIAGNEVLLRHTANGVDRTERIPYRKNSDGAAIKDVLVSPGDTVIIPRAGIVYILGAVVRPGGYIMQEDGHLDVAQALSLALGTSLQGRVGGTRIIRRRPDGTEQVIPVDYAKVMAGQEVAAVLAPEDIVYVPISKVKTVLTTGASLIGSAATSTVYAVRP